MSDRVPIFSLSKWGLYQKCLYSLTLELPKRQSRAATNGKRLHAAICNALTHGEPLPEEPSLMRFAEWASASVPPMACHSEPALALDVRTGAVRLLGYNIDRKYREHGATSFDVCCSLDLLIDYGGVMVVHDIKSGRMLGQPAQSPQLRGCGALAHEMFDRPRWELAYGYLRPHVYDVHQEPVSRGELIREWNLVRARGQQFLDGDTAPQAGTHCDAEWCDARPQCAAYQAFKKSQEKQQMAQSNVTSIGSRMSLGAVQRGKLKKPLRGVVYSPEGVGKSTFGASAPAPIFLCPEDGTAQLDIARFPEPKSWQDINDAVALLKSEGHEYRTLVLDTLDWFEPLLWRFVCERGGKPDIESFGFGKGYVLALDEWRAFLAKLDELRSAKGMHIIALAHSHIRPFQNPESDNYDRYELKLHAKAAALWKEWADFVFFANWETATVDSNGKSKGVATGRRVMFTERRAAYDAKNRYGLPHELEFSWAAFVDAVRQAQQTEQQKESA